MNLKIKILTLATIIALILLSCEKEEPHTGTVTDYDGNSYNTVKIGNQWWMVENLKVTKYNDGTAIPLVTDNTAWTNLTTPGYCWYNNDEATIKNPYGALYNWHTVNTSKLCPTGWHVPSDAEWTKLRNYLGGEIAAGGKLKETGTTHWDSPNTGATNETGFTGLPGGYCSGHHEDSRSFYGLGTAGDFWSATMGYYPQTALKWGLYCFSTDLDGGCGIMLHGFSVRCLKDN
ncbi:MAG: fibrobacter succinogenes major paralogous domain-containing protein [Bacteroidales bacterium]|nr:fibrobacter succinogenes major paralogous domain-containing protein [Bacteroidales bacterium]